MSQRLRLLPRHPLCCESCKESSPPTQEIIMADPHTTRQNALTLLEEEHRAVEKLFDAFRHADNDLERKATLVQRACVGREAEFKMLWDDGTPRYEPYE
jgi:hypothetical protein